jgi:thiol-disulfide isomerase/thioredoxin
MPQHPDDHQPQKHLSGPGPLSYIAGLSLAAIAGFAVAGLWFIDADRAPRDTGLTTAAQAPASAASSSAYAAEASAGMEKLVVHDTPREVPEFGFIDGDGEARTLSHWRGKLLLVNIWATWCAPCKEEMPALSRLEAKRGGEDFAVLPISVDRGGLDKPRAFLQQIGADNLPLLLEESGRLNVTLDVLGLPATLIIDPDGREIARMLGPAEWDAPKAIARLEELMAR